MQRSAPLVAGCAQQCTASQLARPQNRQSRRLLAPGVGRRCSLVGSRRQAAAASQRQVGSGGGGSGGSLAVLPRRRQACLVRATPGSSGGGGPGPGSGFGEKQQRKLDQQVVVGVGIGLTVFVLVALRLGGEMFQDADAWDLGLGNDATFGAGDAVGALLWSGSLYFCSPLQLLGLFFGYFETDRPSDWVLKRLGTASGLDVDALDYRVPAGLQAAAVAFFGVSGFALATAFQALLGDATWSVSTGLGACMGAAMYEVGRPRRLTVEQAQVLEKQWQEFAKFADVRLQRSGRCHETEILKALKRDMPKYRAEGSIDATIIRDLVRNWHPEAERTSNGYYRGISLQTAGGSGGSSPSSSTSSSTAA